MNKYVFSPATLSFYPIEMKARYEANDSWPTDGVEVDEQTFQTFIQSPPDGKVKGATADGMPCWVDVPVDVVERFERAWRDNELLDTVDVLSLPLRWASYSDEQKTALSNYREALLDYPQQPDFPNGDRPVAPVL